MRQISRSFSFVGVAIAVATGISLPAEAANFDGLVFFGDSLVDQGNFLPLTGGTFPNSPYFFPGRFSNGLVFSDYLAADLGLSGSTINYAMGGGTTGSGTVSPIPGAVGLQQQISAFTNGTDLFGAPVSIPSNSLYTVWAGANDYFLTAEQASFPVLRQAIAGQAVLNIASAVAVLAVSGADDILIPNLPDLSQTPLGASGSSQSQFNLRRLTKLHNRYLSLAVDVFEQIFPNKNFIEFDTYDFFQDIVEDPSAFGITNTTQACTKTNLYDPVNPFPDPTNIFNAGCSAANANNYLYWDSVHPNTAIHELIADSVLTQLEQEDNSNSFASQLAFGEETISPEFVVEAVQNKIASTNESNSAFCLLAFGMTGGVMAWGKRQRK